MPQYQLTIQKSAGGVYWTNRYFAQADDFNEAQQAGIEVAAAEQAIHLNYVTMVSLRTSLVGVEDPSQYLIYPLEGNGQRAADTPLPLTICVRAINLKGPGAPDVKYLRGCVNAADILNPSTFKPASVNAYEVTYSGPLFAVEGLVSEDGRSYTSCAVSPKIAQHQLSRGTRKRTEPVIPVS